MATTITIILLSLALIASLWKIVKLNQEVQAEKHDTARFRAWSEIANDFPVLGSPIAENEELKEAHKPKTKRKTTSSKKPKK